MKKKNMICFKIDNLLLFLSILFELSIFINILKIQVVQHNIMCIIGYNGSNQLLLEYTTPGTKILTMNLYFQFLSHILIGNDLIIYCNIDITILRFKK